MARNEKDKRLPGTAADSFLGYLYQAEVALLELTRRRIETSSLVWAVSIEVFDDVVFERGAAPENFLQTKSSVEGAKDLGDRSVDLWKSIRNWCQLVTGGHVNLDDVSFELWTTGIAPEDSAAARLRSQDRDTASAYNRLVRAARSSENQTNARAYEAFLELEESTRQELVEHVIVRDGSPRITAIDQELSKLVFAGAEPSRLDAFTRRLRDWWYGRVRMHLLRDDEGRIESYELDVALKDIREQLIGTALPLDVLRDDPRLEELSTEDRTFVRQMVLIAIESPALALAIRDYKRAYLQRSLWLQDDLLPTQDLMRYEDTLIDEWERHRSVTHKGSYASEEEMVAYGRELFERIGDLQLRIHESRPEGFLCRGSYHILADELRVGWHPEFVSRLREVISAA